MGTILRSLNTTNTRKRRTLHPDDSQGESRFRISANSMGAIPSKLVQTQQAIAMPSINKVREVVENEDDEIY